MSAVPVSFRRAGLRTLIVSITVSAAAGVFALVRGDFGETEGKILLTALAIAAASVLTLASGIAVERGRAGRIPHAAILGAVLGFALLIAAIWREFSPDGLTKTAASVIFVSAALTHWSLMALANLAPRFRWIHLSSYPLAALMAGFLLGLVWGGWEGSGSAQVGGVIAILTVAVTILVPVLQRLDTSMPAGARAINFCPYCGEALESTAGPVVCPSCGAGFRVRAT